MSQIKGAPTPPDEDDGVTELQEKILLLLEAAGIPTEANDAVMKIIADGERGLVPCDVCGQPVDSQADACSHCA